MAIICPMETKQTQPTISSLAFLDPQKLHKSYRRLIVKGTRRILKSINLNAVYVLCDLHFSTQLRALVSFLWTKINTLKT